MEVFRHARRRSKYHSMHHEELVREQRARRSSRPHASRKPKQYNAEDEEWRHRRNHLNEEDDDET